MTPKLSILPLAQQKLWPQLVSIPERFILYGGTAVALQLGHRESVDFDFFSLAPLDRQQLVSVVPLLQTCQIIQPEIKQYLIAATKRVRTIPLFTPFLAPAHR